MELKNKVAIIIGIASGFSAEITRSYIRKSARVIIDDLNEAGTHGRFRDRFDCTGSLV